MPPPPLPSTESTWLRRVKQLGLKTTLHTANMKSASAIQEDQYLLLRVLWKRHSILKSDWTNLENRAEETGAFMTMHQYGPWDTGNAAHMKQMAVILVAIVLRAFADFQADNDAKENNPLIVHRITSPGGGFCTLVGEEGESVVILAEDDQTLKVPQAMSWGACDNN